MDLQQLKEISLLALKKANQLHEQLGVSGEEIIAKNEHGETALKIDVEAEKVVISTFREAKVPIKIIRLPIIPIAGK